MVAGSSVGWEEEGFVLNREGKVNQNLQNKQLLPNLQDITGFVVRQYALRALALIASRVVRYCRALCDAARAGSLQGKLSRLPWPKMRWTLVEHRPVLHVTNVCAPLDGMYRAR